MKYNKIYAALIPALSLMACEDMDTMPAGSVVSAEGKKQIVEADPSKADASIGGALMSLSQMMPNGSYHSDFGYPSIMLFTDVMGEDHVVSVNGYQWFSRPFNWDSKISTSPEAMITWNNLYSYIFNANSIISSLPAAPEDPVMKVSIAQGLALRAFSYFQLAQLFQFTYVGHEDAPCVPLVTEENSDDYAINGGKRATVKEIYDQIYKDLDKAVTFLGEAAAEGEGVSDKSYISQSVALGLRARVNLVTNNWDAAAADAKAAIEASKAKPASVAEVSKPTFWSVNEPNWMWGIIIAPTDDVVSSGIVNWPSFMGTMNYGYTNYNGGIQISAKLYSSINESDVRKGWWLNENGESPLVTDAINNGWIQYAGVPVGMFYAPLTNVKFGADNDVYVQTENGNDIVLMRIEEMHMIIAEVEARKGDGSYLENFVKTYRDPSYSVADATAGGMSLLQEVWRQRRIEFWGEGLSYFDIMRLQSGIDRRGTGAAMDYIFAVKADDTNMLWPIPLSEIEGNPALETEDNNPAYVKPAAVADDPEANLLTETIK